MAKAKKDEPAVVEEPPAEAAPVENAAIPDTRIDLVTGAAEALDHARTRHHDALREIARIEAEPDPIKRAAEAERFFARFGG